MGTSDPRLASPTSEARDTAAGETHRGARLSLPHLARAVEGGGDGSGARRRCASASPDRREGRYETPSTILPRTNP